MLSHIPMVLSETLTDATMETFLWSPLPLNELISLQPDSSPPKCSNFKSFEIVIIAKNLVLERFKIEKCPFKNILDPGWGIQSAANSPGILLMMLDIWKLWPKNMGKCACKDQMVYSLWQSKCTKMWDFMWKVARNITQDTLRPFGQTLDTDLRLCTPDFPPNPNHRYVFGSLFGFSASDLLLDNVISMGDW